MQAVKLDQALQRVGYDAEASKLASVKNLIRLAPQIPDYGCALLILELLYREIPIAQQDELKAACGNDEMQAAYQLNMMCIDPENEDRTLLQLRHIGLKLTQEAEAAVSSGTQVQLSDSRMV